MKIAAASFIAIVLLSTVVKGHEAKDLQLSPSAAGPGQDPGKRSENDGKMGDAHHGMKAGDHPCGPAPGPFPDMPHGPRPEGHGPVPGPLPVLKHGMLGERSASSHDKPCGKPSVPASGPFPGADFLGIPSQNGGDFAKPNGPHDRQSGPAFKGPGGRKLK